MKISVPGCGAVRSRLALAPWLAAILLAMVPGPATADGFHLEEMRIPMAAAGPRGLEALLIRPAGPGKYPLALISHGAPVSAADMPAMSPYGFYLNAIEFARRGFAALVVMRRGYGSSDGGYAERGCCALANYLNSARAGAADLRAAVEAMQDRSDVTGAGMIAVGVSAGGLASVALAEHAPPGLAAVISFAGGRRGSDPAAGIRDPDDEAALVGAFAMLGKTSRTPMLWVYAENDGVFRPELAHRLRDAFIASGGRVQMIDAPAYGNDGHALFTGEGRRSWTPLVDGFLRAHQLGAGEMLAVLPSPRCLSEFGRAAFAEYLAGLPHKAFAASPRGDYGYHIGARNTADALAAALAGCAERAPDCALYAIEDELGGDVTTRSP